MHGLITKVGPLFLGSLLLVSVNVPALAFDATSRAQLRTEIQEEIKEGSRPGLLRDLGSKLLSRAAIGSATLTAIAGSTAPTTLTVLGKDGKTYTININTNTQLRRRFWGKAALSEFQVGDTLNIIGRWTDNTHTAVNAVLVRNASIQKRNGVFFGTVTSLLSTGWVMDTLHRGSETVTVSTSTKFVNRRGQTITQTDIKVGDKIRVRGLWDKKNSTITEVTHVKDYSLPPKTATPSATPH